MGQAGFPCPMLSTENIPTPAKSGAGSGYFPQPATTPTDRREKSAGIIFTNRSCNAHSERRVLKLVFLSLPAATLCAMLRHNNHLFNILYFKGNSGCPTTVGGNFFPLCTL